MGALLIIEDIKTIKAEAVGSNGNNPEHFYLNLTITGNNGSVTEFCLSSKDKAVLDQLAGGSNDSRH
ncbi:MULTISPECIES: hypothetical protein [Methylobacter]